MRGRPGGPRTGQFAGDRRFRWLLGACIFTVHLLSPEVTVGDSRLSSITAWRWLTHFDLHLESYRVVTSLRDHYDLVSAHGHLVPYFPWPTMLFALPADLLLAATGRDPGTLSVINPARTFLVEIPTAAAIVAITSLLIRGVVRSLVPGGSRIPTVCALVFAFGTSAWSIGSRALWQQTVSMMFVALAVLAASRLADGGRWPVVLGLALAAAPLVRPTDAVFAALLLAWVAVRHRTLLLAVLAPGALLLLVFGAFSAWQYGSILPPYYLPTRLTGPGPISFLPGLAMNLVSPSRGLLVYDPVLALSVAGLIIGRRHPTGGTAPAEQTRDRKGWQGLNLVMAAAVLAQLLIIAKFGSTGGHAFGPRLMIDILPLLVILAVPLLAVLDRRPNARTPRQRWAAAAVIGVLAIGMAVNGTGALLRSTRCWNISPVDVDAAPQRIWDWSDPQFAWPYHQLVAGGSISDVTTPVCRAH